MDDSGIRRKHYGFKSNAHHHGAGAAITSNSSGKRKGNASAAECKGKACAATGGKKPPIKVVLIGNPVRVTITKAGFRALVQELIGRDASPNKYNSSGATAIDVDDSSPVELHQVAAVMLLPALSAP